jgi:DNA-binding transcriptional LysR family regulator
MLTTAGIRNSVQTISRNISMSNDASRALDEEGEVRIAITEGLGTFWLAPRLVDFQASQPGMLVNLNCAMQPVERPPHEREVIVQLFAPREASCRAVRLGRLHAMPFASPGYVATHGLPRTMGDFAKHRVVLQLAEQTATRENFERMFPTLPRPDFVATRTNTSSAHYWTIANGGGIGMLPTYAVAVGADVVPIDLGVSFPFDIWLVHHAEAERIEPVRRVIAWLIESFDATHFPWFADAFIHPNELLKHYRGAPLSGLFENLTPSTQHTTLMH